MSTFDLVVIWIAAIPATAALLLYGCLSAWWRFWPGRAFFSTMLAVALLLDLTIFFQRWHGHLAAKEDIAKGVYVVVAIACWLKCYAVIRQQIIRRRR